MYNHETQYKLLKTGMFRLFLRNYVRIIRIVRMTKVKNP
jgi:hypothetical protein